MRLNFSNLHILVVEDIRPMQDLIAELLYAMGVGKVTRAKDGVEGYESYNYEKPDIIITDWNMPKMNGLEMVQKIRRDKNSHDRTIPIIMLTGYCSEDRINLSRNLGTTEFLAKPFSAHDVAKRIIHVIQHPRDFIAAPDFIGPDRRRKVDKDFEGPSNRTSSKDCKKIKASTKLQKKVGMNPAVKSTIDPAAIEKSQKIIDTNTIDFITIAENFLAQLQHGLEYARQKDLNHRQALDGIIYPIMQIKANASIFNYHLVGDLAGIMLDFLESLNVVDEKIIEIVETQQTTLAHLTDRKMSGHGGDVGASLKKELENACKRYRNTRAFEQQAKFAEKTKK